MDQINDFLSSLVLTTLLVFAIAAIVVTFSFLIWVIYLEISDKRPDKCYDYSREPSDLLAEHILKERLNGCSPFPESEKETILREAAITQKTTLQKPKD